MREIKSFTVFTPDPFGNGAERRTFQIKEVLESNGYSWGKIPVGIAKINYSNGYFGRFLKVLSLNIAIVFRYSLFPSLKRVLKNTWLYSHFLGILDIEHNYKNKVILFENTKMEFFHILLYLKKKGYRIIGIPHNLESLVPLQKSGITNIKSPKWFAEEIRMLEQCDHIFTISKEETLLLRNFNINADYLPFFPADSATNFLLNIRSEREKNFPIEESPIRQVLMLGSFVNTPTKKGLLNRIEFFNANPHPNIEILVAGYGTSGINDFITISNTNIKILGTLDQNELKQILEKVDSLLIHQGPASGALTRIQESLIAGVPVIANFNSARDYFGTNGLYSYSDDDEMTEAILLDKPIPIQPQKPVKAYIRFINKVNNINGVKIN